MEALILNFFLALNTIDKDSLQYITLGNAIKKKLLNLITLHVCLSTRKLKFGLTLGKNYSSKQRISSFTFCQVIFWVALSLRASSPMEAARELVPRFRVSSRVSTFHDIPQMESLLAG